MKALAVDFGTKRLGVALGADDQVIFSKTLTISSERGATAALSKIISDEAVQAIIIGLPLRLDGTEKHEAQHVRQFGVALSRTTRVPVVFLDERLTSEEAMSILRAQGLSEKKMRGKLDEVVAKLLLEQYYRNDWQDRETKQ